MIMEAFKNWLLPILMIISAFAEQYFDLITDLLASFGVSSKLIIILKLVFGFVGIILLKLQAPSLKKAKQAKQGYYPEH